MTQQSSRTRIDDALARIEAAATAHYEASAAAARRHATLKHEVARALAALDDVLAARGSD